MPFVLRNVGTQTDEDEEQRQQAAILPDLDRYDVARNIVEQIFERHPDILLLFQVGGFHPEIQNELDNVDPEPLQNAPATGFMYILGQYVFNILSNTRSAGQRILPPRRVLVTVGCLFALYCCLPIKTRNISSDSFVALVSFVGGIVAKIVRLLADWLPGFSGIDGPWPLSENVANVSRPFIDAFNYAMTRLWAARDTLDVVHNYFNTDAVHDRIADVQVRETAFNFARTTVRILEEAGANETATYWELLENLGRACVALFGRNAALLGQAIRYMYQTGRSSHDTLLQISAYMFVILQSIQANTRELTAAIMASRNAN